MIEGKVYVEVSKNPLKGLRIVIDYPLGKGLKAYVVEDHKILSELLSSKAMKIPYKKRRKASVLIVGDILHRSEYLEIRRILKKYISKGKMIRVKIITLKDRLYLQAVDDSPKYSVAGVPIENYKIEKDSEGWNYLNSLYRIVSYYNEYWFETRNGTIMGSCEINKEQYKILKSKLEPIE